MAEQLKREFINSPEKSANQIYDELNQTHDEVMGLMDQVHELERKAVEGDLSKEEFDSIVAERNQLAAQLDEKWETEKQLEKQWIKIGEEEMKKLEQTLIY